MPINDIDWSIIVGQGIFCVLFVYLFIDTRKEGSRREQLMRDSFAARESKFMELQDKFIAALHENSQSICKLSDLIASKLDEMKDRIDAQDRYPVHGRKVD